MSFSISGVFKGIESGAVKFGQILSDIIRLGNAVRSTWASCGPQTLVVASQILYDAVKSIAALSAEATDVSAGNFNGAIQLSPQTTSALQTLWADFQRGEQQVVADFKALEYSFTNPPAAN